MTSPPRFVSRTLFSQGAEGTDSFMTEDNYEKILTRKGASIRSLFTDYIDFDQIELIPSPKLTGFRQRCRFGIIRKEDGELCFSIWESGENTLLESKFEVASDTMNTTMNRLKYLLNCEIKYRSLIDGISAINFHENRVGNEMLITLCNGRPLCPEFSELAAELAEELGVKAVLGRAKKECVLSSNTTDASISEVMNIYNNNEIIKTITYLQPEGSFSNPNGDIAELTANWLCDRMRQEEMKLQNRKFIEFYCGNANHGCYLSDYFTEVVGVEIDEELCKAAEKNLRNNGVSNFVIINKPAEDVAKRKYLYNFNDNDFLLVDPPRAGLDELTLSLVRQFKSVIYIACDARSLARDLKENGLGESHQVKYMAAFDHFPWHAEFLEVVCWLERKE